jgi:hypothetical protein
MSKCIPARSWLERPNETRVSSCWTREPCYAHDRYVELPGAPKRQGRGEQAASQVRHDGTMATHAVSASLVETPIS